MIGTIWVVLIVIVFIGTWLATIERAMTMATPLVLRHEMESRGTTRRGVWISEQYEVALQSVIFAKTICFFGTVTGFILLFGSPVTTQNYVAGCLVGIVVVWLFMSVIAGSIAQAVSVGAVTRSWFLIRIVSITNPLTSGLIRFVGEISRRLTGANLKLSDGSNGVEEQLLRSIEHSQREGGIPAEAAEMLENVVDLSDTDVGEIMTPRTDIEGIELTNDLAEIRKFVLESGRSRIPVYEENLDQILGILYVKDLVGYLGAEANGFELTTILRKPIVVPDAKSVQELLADFQTSEVHMAVVIDEYGGTAGLVTIEDVLEEIVGEIRDEHDDSEQDEPVLKRIGKATVEVDGRFPLDDLNDDLGIQLPEDEEYDTVAGFVLANLGHVPQVGETLETCGLSFTALEATETQIDRLLIDFSSSDL